MVTEAPKIAIEHFNPETIATTATHETIGLIGLIEMIGMIGMTAPTDFSEPRAVTRREIRDFRRVAEDFSRAIRNRSNEKALCRRVRTSRFGRKKKTSESSRNFR